MGMDMKWQSEAHHPTWRFRAWKSFQTPSPQSSPPKGKDGNRKTKEALDSTEDALNIAGSEVLTPVPGILADKVHLLV